MKSTNALVAAALAGVFAAGTTVSHAASIAAPSVTAEKDKCNGKDACPGKDKKKEEGTITMLAKTAAAAADKDKCDGKDGCKGKDKAKDKDKCSSKDGCKGKDKEKSKDGEIL